MGVREDLLVKQGGAGPGASVVGLWILGIVAILVFLPLVLEGFHALDGQFWGGVWRRQPRQLWGMVEVMVVMVVVGVDQVSHCHCVMAVSPRRVMLLAVGKEGIVDLRRGHLQLVVLTLAVQEAVELGQTAEGQRVRDRRLGIFRQLLCLVARVVTVAGDQEAREEGAKDKGHQNTRDEESVVDAVVGLLQLRRPPHTFKNRKREREKGTSVRAFFFFRLSQKKKEKMHFQELM